MKVGRDACSTKSLFDASLLSLSLNLRHHSSPSLGVLLLLDATAFRAEAVAALFVSCKDDTRHVWAMQLAASLFVVPVQVSEFLSVEDGANRQRLLFHFKKQHQIPQSIDPSGSFASA